MRGDSGCGIVYFFVHVLKAQATNQPPQCPDRIVRGALAQSRREGRGAAWWARSHSIRRDPAEGRDDAQAERGRHGGPPTAQYADLVSSISNRFHHRAIVHHARRLLALVKVRTFWNTFTGTTATRCALGRSVGRSRCAVQVVRYPLSRALDTTCSACSTNPAAALHCRHSAGATTPTTTLSARPQGRNRDVSAVAGWPARLRVHAWRRAQSSAMRTRPRRRRHRCAACNGRDADAAGGLCPRWPLRAAQRVGRAREAAQRMARARPDGPYGG